MRKIDLYPDLLIPLLFLIFITHSYWGDVYVKARYRRADAVVTRTGIGSVRQWESCGEDCSEEVTAFLPDIRYEYVVGSTRYFGSKFRNSSRGKSRAWATNIASEFGVGDSINVYYDPAAPGESVISKEFGDEISGLAIAIPIIVLMMLVGVVRRRYGLPISDEDDDEKPPYEGFRPLRR